MTKSKKYVLSVEVYKYPYCCTLDDTENYLSNKISCYTIRTRKKIIKKAIIVQVIKEMPAEIYFTEKEIDKLYNLSIECRNNYLSKEQLITKISNLRGGFFIDIVGALGIISAIIILATNDWGLAFQPNPHVIIPPHLQWLYEWYNLYTI